MNVKKLVGFAIVGTFAVALLAPVALAQETGTPFGERPGSSQVVPLSALLITPQNYVGTTVQVSGVLTDVCTAPGCWIKLGAGAGDEDALDIAFDDEGIVFPKGLVGKQASVEGVMTKNVLTLEQSVAYMQHEAEVRGEEFDPASVTSPITLYKFKGSGAVVY